MLPAQSLRISRHRLRNVCSILYSTETRRYERLERLRSELRNSSVHEISPFLPTTSEETLTGSGKKVLIETYGCQMNVNDTEIAKGILKDHNFGSAASLNEADVVLLMTCAIREGAEQKIWHRLQYLRHLKRRRKHGSLTVGVLGCMAERLKQRLVEKESCVDVVCGPDAYRDLPTLIDATRAQHTDRAAINVQLSLEETYADVTPVRVQPDSPSAFVSIMRGCDNMCTYCIVPFTRGRERSRAISSILREIRQLNHQGVKEVILLGQNVNSYRDLSEQTTGDEVPRSEGFSTVYKPRSGGLRFAHLLEQVAAIDPEMRVRFTSPHPKDFPDEVLQVMKNHDNICKSLHLPAQSGSSRVLGLMGRGYTRTAYLQLVDRIKHFLPDVALSSDFISGFCGETEEDHEETLSLMTHVKYTFAYCFPYSMRQKTRAFHRLSDDVAAEVKLRRHTECIDTFRGEAHVLNNSAVGRTHLVLVTGTSKRSSSHLVGRNESFVKVIFPRHVISCHVTGSKREARVGDYVAVKIEAGSSQSLRGLARYITTLQDFHSRLTPLTRTIH